MKNTRDKNWIVDNIKSAVFLQSNTAATIFLLLTI